MPVHSRPSTGRPGELAPPEETEQESNQGTEAWKQWKRAYEAAFSVGKEHYPEQRFFRDDRLLSDDELNPFPNKQVPVPRAWRIEHQERRSRIDLFPTHAEAEIVVLDHG